MILGGAAPGRIIRDSLASFARQFPHRLRERNFWRIQAMVLVVTGLHLFVEASPHLTDYSTVQHVPVTLYVIPILYAGLSYGSEGGVLTGLWCALLTVPNFVLFHRDTAAWLGELLQVAVILAMGIVIAWRVEREAGERRKAESTSARLALLNEITSAASQTLDLERVLTETVGKIAEGLDAERAWLCLRDERTDELSLAARWGLPIHWPDGKDGEEGYLWESLSTQAVALRRPTLAQDMAVAAPLMAKGKVLGAVGVACPCPGAYGAGEAELLAAIGRHIGVAVDNARLYREERQMQEALRRYAQQVTQAQEEERKRIARELHDDAAHALLVLRRRLDALRDSGRRLPKDAVRELDEVRAMADTTLQNIRRFSRDLRPSVLDDLGLIPAIEWLTSELACRTGVNACVEVGGAARRLETNQELALFRIVQEALDNAEKHSAATEAVVRVTFESACVEVCVSDNGHGFQPVASQDLSRRGKLGLLGMKERAELLGGTLDVRSRPGHGARISVRLQA